MKPRLTPNFLSAFLFMAFFSLNAYAQQIPVHRDDVFKGLQLDIEKEKQKAKELAAKEREEKQKLEELEKQILPIAGQIQASEQTLIELEDSIKKNEGRQKELEDILNDNQKLLSENFIATLKLKRVPAETLFLQAATPLQTAQTAMLLERTIPQIKNRMDFLSRSAKELAQVQKDLTSQRSKKETELANLLLKQEEMEDLIDSRQALIKRTHKDYQQSQSRTAKLTKDAETLKELVSKVRAQNEQEMKEQAEREAKAAKAQKVAAVARQAAPPPMSSGSNGNWPVAGTLAVNYGMTDVYGAKSEGVKIQTRPAALVTTPLPGIVRFAGPFKNYNQIVIIEHDGGWHSLIGGMSEVSTIVGQTVNNGEPVGKMSSQNDVQGLLLYYELRYKGNPVNPSKKIKGLN